MPTTEAGRALADMLQEIRQDYYPFSDYDDISAVRDVEAEARAEGYAAGLAAARRLAAAIPCLMHVPPGRCLDVDMAPPSWSPCANCQVLAAIDALAVDPRSEEQG